MSNRITLLVAGMVGAAATAAATVLASAYAFGGPAGYVFVQPASAPLRPSPGEIAAEPEETPSAGSPLTDVAATVHERLADPDYHRLLLRDEPSALRFLFDSALALDRPEEAWQLLEDHPVFAAHLSRAAWARLASSLDERQADVAATALAAAQDLFGPSFAR